MQERKERARVLAMISILIPDGERQDGQHDKHHAHWDSLAAAAQGLITKSATVLTAGTRAPAARSIAAIWANNGGRFLLRSNAEGAAGSVGGANAVSVLGGRSL
jgi:hypothetical protein